LGGGVPRSKEEQENLLDQLVEAIGTKERLRDLLNQHFGAEALDVVATELTRDLAKWLTDKLENIFDDFWDHQRWFQLAGNPEEFNEELEKAIARLRRWMKTVHQIPSHRPNEKMLRDGAVHALRHQGKSYGQIGIMLGITDKVAERACKRYEEYQKRDLRRALEFFLEVSDWRPSADPRKPS
jgi:hypothetical protein